MDWSYLADSPGWWGFLGSVVTAVGIFALGVWKVLTGKEVSFRNDLLNRVQQLEEALVAQRVYYEQRQQQEREALREFYEALLEEERRTHAEHLQVVKREDR